MSMHPSPGVRRREPIPLRTLGLVACGAAVGSIARYAASEPWGEHIETTAVAYAVINVVGSLLLGLLTGLLTPAAHEDAPRGRPTLLPLLGSGFCGGFTTFSGAMTADGPDLVSTLAFLTAQLVGGIVAVLAGLSCGRLLRRRRVSVTRRSGGAA